MIKFVCIQAICYQTYNTGFADKGFNKVHANTGFIFRFDSLSLIANTTAVEGRGAFVINDSEPFFSGDIWQLVSVVRRRASCVNN